MTYDHELTLIQQQVVLDPVEEPAVLETETVILCGLKSVGRNEFYAAAASGLRPEIVFVIHGYEYSGEQAVKFESARYTVVRTYATSFEELELSCEKAVADDG